MTLGFVVGESIPSCHGILTSYNLDFFPLLLITENLARDGVNGIRPHGRPWNISSTLSIYVSPIWPVRSRLSVLDCTSGAVLVDLSCVVDIHASSESAVMFIIPNFIYLFVCGW